MKFLTYFIFFICLAFFNSTYASNEESSELIKQCRSKLKTCQQLHINISVDYKNRSWDIEKNEYPLEAINGIQDIYNDFHSCQGEYHACIESRELDRDSFKESLRTLPESTWKVSSLESQGLDQTLIDQAVDNASKIRDLRSLLVIKNGYLISENYFQLKDDPSPQWVASVTKSIVSILTYMAIEKGFIDSEYSTIDSYFSDYFANHDKTQKEDIRIIDLLQMRSGLEYADIDYWFTYDVKPGVTYTDYWRDDNAKDYALQFDMIAKPGENYLYNSPAVNLLTTAINESAGMSAGKFADKFLFNPLGIQRYIWVHDSNEYYRGSHVLFIRPRGLAKIGQLILDDGIYESNEIISTNSINKMFEVHEKNVWEGLFKSTNTTLDYAGLWYVFEMNGHQVKMAYGYGGNFIIIAPELELVIVTTANNDISLESGLETPDRIFKDILSVLIR